MMQQNYRYTIFGLNINSQIPLPELIEVSDWNVDVQVTLGEVPDELAKPEGRGVLFQAAPGEFLLRIPNVARFYVTNGNKVVIEMAKEIAHSEARPFLYGPALGALLWQRKCMVFHGSVINFGKEAWIVSGNSGAGKSSLAGAALKAGLQVATDDTVALDLSEGIAKAWPGYPYIKLWEDVVEQLQLMDTVKGPVREQIRKFYHPLGEQFVNEALPVKGVVWLNSHNKQQVEATEVEGLDKFNILRQATHRLRYVQGLGMVREHFRLLGKVASDFRVITLARPQQPVDPEGLLEAIQKYLHQL